uniref:arginine N-succinyltransferase n=1 Tax=Acinetobacter baumannii TaxID=470 RepID=UPI0025A08EEE
MMIIRYIEPRDVNDLYLLAQKAGFGLTSLQPNMEKLAARIERACKTVAGELPKADRHCCKVSDEAAFCLIQRPYISKTLLT